MSKVRDLTEYRMQRDVITLLVDAIESTYRLRSVTGALECVRCGRLREEHSGDECEIAIAMEAYGRLVERQK